MSILSHLSFTKLLDISVITIVILLLLTLYSGYSEAKYFESLGPRLHCSKYRSQMQAQTSDSDQCLLPAQSPVLKVVPISCCSVSVESRHHFGSHGTLKLMAGKSRLQGALRNLLSPHYLVSLFLILVVQIQVMKKSDWNLQYVWAKSYRNTETSSTETRGSQ